MPLLCSVNCRRLQCVMWKATYLFTSLLRMLVCPKFECILMCKAEYQFFVEAIMEFYSVWRGRTRIRTIIYWVCWYDLFLDILLCDLSTYIIYVRIFMILRGMPLVSSSNCWVLQCVMWNATHLYTCLVIILVCRIFVDVLSCKSESHSYVQATIILQCVMWNATNFNTCLVTMLVFVDILFVCQNVTHLLKQL